MPHEDEGEESHTMPQRVAPRAELEGALDALVRASQAMAEAQAGRDEARAQAENLAEALDVLLIGGRDAVSMEHAKRAAKVVLRSYRKARDAT